MIKFGLIDEWAPLPGAVTSWTPTEKSRQAALDAPKHDTRPSHIQQAYLEAAHRNFDSGFRFSRLLLVALDMFGTLDRGAMTVAINQFVKRHDSFATWFSTDANGSVRHLIDRDTLDLAPTEHGIFATSEAIRHHVQEETPGPERWDCFTFGVVERADHFTLYAAVDHLATDGISQAVTMSELRQLYRNEVDGTSEGVRTVSGYIDYCERERQGSDLLTRQSPTVEKWIEIVRDNGGDLPHFALDLGTESEGYTRSAHRSFPMLDAREALAFDEACKSMGARFIGGIFAAAALAELELTDRQTYFGLTPNSTRATLGEFGSVGWFTSLIPVTFSVPNSRSFLKTVKASQDAFKFGKQFSGTSFHRVLELVGPDDGITTQPGWTAPMISYLDVRRLPGVAGSATAADVGDVGVFGNRGSSEEVFMWINRFEGETRASFLFPGTDIAQRSVETYFLKMAEIFQSVAATGDYISPTIDLDLVEREMSG